MDTVSKFGVLSDDSYAPCSMSSSGKPLSRRACNECRRKKTRCDMRHPKCSLCSNIGSTCSYRGEARQRIHRRSTAISRSSIDTMESAENQLNTSKSPANLDGLVSLDDIDVLLYDLSNTHGPTMAFLEPVIGFDSFGAAPWPKTKPFAQECFPIAIEPSQIESEIDRNDSLSVSEDLANDLIDLYFEKVQGICPLFMREKLNVNHLPNGTCRDERFRRLSLVVQFVLNGMFALSARHSSSSKFAGLDPHCRGQQFVKKATELWESIKRDWSHSVRTLQCLQGLILMTFNLLQSGPSETAWNLTGTCVRLEYNLDLHTMDSDKIDSEVNNWQDGFQHRWASLEEMRRARWMVWEMDTFSSTVSSRPYGIDSQVVQVLLPVADQDWMSKCQAWSVSLSSASEMPLVPGVFGCSQTDGRRHIVRSIDPRASSCTYVIASFPFGNLPNHPSLPFLRQLLRLYQFYYNPYQMYSDTTEIPF